MQLAELTHAVFVPIIVHAVEQRQNPQRHHEGAQREDEPRHPFRHGGILADIADQQVGIQRENRAAEGVGQEVQHLHEREVFRHVAPQPEAGVSGVHHDMDAQNDHHQPVCQARAVAVEKAADQQDCGHHGIEKFQARAQNEYRISHTPHPFRSTVTRTCKDSVA